jgi:predicted esterase
MGQIGSWFAPQFPNALIVSIGGAEPCGPAPARQWFSVQGVTEENRQQRIDAITMKQQQQLLRRCCRALNNKVIVFHGYLLMSQISRNLAPD